MGFLGLLHLDVFNQRLEQEYNAQAIMTAPSVTYKGIIFLLQSFLIIDWIVCLQNISAKVTSNKLIEKYGSDEFLFSNPMDFPDPKFTTELYEPFILGTIIIPGKHYMHCIIKICKHFINKKIFKL